MLTQAETAAAFAELHRREGTFIIPNPWDVGSAYLLAHAGFEALATSSAGYAFSIGKADGQVGHDQTLAHAAEVVAATGLPVVTTARAMVNAHFSRLWNSIQHFL